MSRLRLPRITFKLCALLSLLSMPVAAATVDGGSNGIRIGSLPANTQSVRLSGGGIFLASDNGQFSRAGGFADGQYQYEILATMTVTAPRNTYKSTLNNGRGADVKRAATGRQVVETGGFRIIDGRVIDPSIKE